MQATPLSSPPIRTIGGFLIAAACFAPVAAPAAAPPRMDGPPARVGQIYIVGHERTRQNVILRELPLYPGQPIIFSDLKQAEKNLARLNIFQSNPAKGLKPTVTVLDNSVEPDNPVKDVLVSVQEANSGSLMFGVGVNSSGGLCGAIVIEERNFDILRRPASPTCSPGAPSAVRGRFSAWN